MTKKVLCLTDSLALPRAEPEYCSYEDTWPYLLKNAQFNLHQVSIGGATVSDLAAQIHYQKCFLPDIVVVQCGIVDCAPRFMKKFELSFCRKLGRPGLQIIKLFNRKTVKKIRNIAYTSSVRFSENLNIIENAFNNIPVFFIGILPASFEYEQKLPGITKRIGQYNSILKKKEGYISVDDFDMDGIMSDFHHINSRGHIQIFEKILLKLNS